MMTCTVCRHENRDEINQELLACTPLRDIATRFQLSKAALFRHKKADIPSALLQANQIEDHVRADTLLDRLKELNLETQFILSEAQESGDPDIALKSIARLEKQLELEARLLGELNEQTRIAIGINNAPQQQQTKLDLSVLTDDELNELQRLYKKIGTASPSM